MIKMERVFKTKIFLLILYYFSSGFKCFSSNIISSSERNVVISGERKVEEILDEDNNLVNIKVDHPYTLKNIDYSLLKSMAKNRLLYRDLFVYDLKNLENKILKFSGNSTIFKGKDITVSNLFINESYIDINTKYYNTKSEYNKLNLKPFSKNFDSYMKYIEIVKNKNTGIFLFLQEITFIKNKFKSNFIKSYDDDMVNLDIYKAKFIDNSIKSYIFYFYKLNSFIIRDSLFKNNSSNFIIGIRESFKDIILTNVTFENNISSLETTGYISSKNLFFIKDCIFNNNYNSSFCIRKNSSNCRISHNKFQNNKSLHIGKGTLNFTLDVNYILENSLFENNEAKFGGAINSYDAYRGEKAIINNLIIRNNKAIDAGGILLKESYTNHKYYYDKYRITNIILSNNEAQNNGGGFYFCKLYKCGLTINNAKIDCNKASNNGGGFYLNKSNIEISNSIILNNKAKNGAAIYLSNKSSIVLNNYINISDNTTISKNNIASIFIDNTSSMTINFSEKNIIFYNNWNESENTIEALDIYNDGIISLYNKIKPGILDIYGGIKGNGEFNAFGPTIIDIHGATIKNKILKFHNHSINMPKIVLDIYDFDNGSRPGVGGKIIADNIEGSIILSIVFNDKETILKTINSGNSNEFNYTVITANKKNNFKVYLEECEFIKNLNIETYIVDYDNSLKIRFISLEKEINLNKEFSIYNNLNNFYVEELTEIDYNFEPAIFDSNNIGYSY